MPSSTGQMPSRLVSPGLRPMRTIVIDAGHGGKDPGTSHHGLQEKHLALDIARKLQAELSARGYQAILTRDTDEFIPLSRRPAIASRASADLFVSVHINANKSQRVTGAEVYYPRESTVDTTLAYPRGLAAAEVSSPAPAIKQILWDLVLTRSRKQSVRMATRICGALREQAGVKCRGIRGARFVVLREAKMPAVLVEVGYVTNREEAARLGTASYRKALAAAIADGVAGFIREQELQTG